MLPETILTLGDQGFLADSKPPIPPRSTLPRCCQWCGGEPAVIFDIDGCWDTEECQRFDRQSETTVWRRWSQ